MNRIKQIIVSFLIVASLANCRKLVEVEAPYTSINSANIYQNDATAAAVLTGIYASLGFENANLFTSSFSGISVYASLSADELTLFDPNNLNYGGYYTNTLLSVPIGGTVDYWTKIYPLVYRANAAIEGIANSQGLTESVAKQLTGEAKFIRSFCFFYLINLFGDIPMPLTTDYRVNSTLSRTPKQEVYNQIINDLKEAQSLLNENYLMGDAIQPYASGSEERVRPNKSAATGLLARVFLYIGDWTNAEVEASKVISNNSLYSIESLSNAFKKNNREAIWQLQPIGTGSRANTGEGQLLILPSTGPSTTFPLFLSNYVVNSFEATDQRKTNWTASVQSGTLIYYYPFKYKIGPAIATTQEYSIVLRLAEMYLIRAEARAQQSKIVEAKSDINAIRNRAQLPNTTANDKGSLLSAIAHERRVELFTEWGHRWLDLKRTSTADAIMPPITAVKGGQWQTTDQLYPIPNGELLKMPQVSQNPGY